MKDPGLNWLDGLFLNPGLLGIPVLLGAPGLFVLACLLKDPGLTWSDGLFLDPGLLGVAGLLGTVCLKEMFCLLFCWLGTSLLIGAPTSSGGEVLLLIFFVLDLFEFWTGLFDICLFPCELDIFWEDSLDLILLFFGLAINWIGGFAGLFIGAVELFWKVFLSWLIFLEVFILIFWFERFAWDWELLVIVGLLKFLGWFEIFSRLSGLFRGFINNGFLFGLSFRRLSFIEEITDDSSSLFCL